jgi:transposase-like protein
MWSRIHALRRPSVARPRELGWLYDRRDLAAWLVEWQATYPKPWCWVEEDIEETPTFCRLARQPSSL